VCERERERYSVARLVGRRSRGGEINGPSNEAIPDIARRADLHSRAGERGRKAKRLAEEGRDGDD